MVESSHAISKKVTITTDSGKEIRGIIGSKPPHVLTPEERKKANGNQKYVYRYWC